MTEPNLAGTHSYALIGTVVTRAFRVLWALEELGLDYELIAAFPHSDAIKTLNPSGKVPALIDHGRGDAVILDSVAAIQYLADKHGALTWPAGSVERARQDSLTQFACDDMDGTLWTLAKHTFVFPKEFRALAAVSPGAAWDFDRAMKSLASRLDDDGYAAGERFTVADIVITHCAGWAARSGLAIGDERILAYLDRVHQRSAYQRAFALREAART